MIIMYHQGIQIMIESDEIIKVTTLDHSKVAMPDSTTASFRIWKFKDDAQTPGEDEIN